ncbi:MAG TPA: transcription initiation factor IIB [Methanosarcinales archaeon]|nr:transcription initiation factor IIB [Methanosarcinales archaeon]
MDNEEIENKCPGCGSSAIVPDYVRAELVCEECGLVVDNDFIDLGPEWRAYDTDQQIERSRVGAPMSVMVHDKGLGTMIDWRDNFGKNIYRLRKWQSRIRVNNGAERSIAIGLSELSRIASVLALPRIVRETAAVLYRKTVKKNLIRGRSIEGFASAVLYIACRQWDIPRTIDEIAEVARSNRKDIKRIYHLIAQKLNLRLTSTSPSNYIPRFCTVLGLNREVQSKSMEILKEASEKEITRGRSPTGVAATTIYIASILCGDRITQKEVAKVAGVTEVTLRNQYKEFAKQLPISNLIAGENWALEQGCFA